MRSGTWLFLFILLGGMFLSVKSGKLTLMGAMAGGMIGFCIFMGAGFTGIVMLGIFFLLGTLATTWKMSLKESMDAAEKNKGRRTAGQVMANGVVAALAGIFAWYFPDQAGWLRVMMAAALASATADTLSSELGTVYGKKFYNILSCRNDRRGENGVISLEGTLFGLSGSIIIAVIYATGFGWNYSMAWIVIAGTIGNITDSLLGASLERRHLLDNNAVNLTNTLIASLAAFALIQISN